MKIPDAACSVCQFFAPSQSPNAGECRRYAPTLGERGGSRWPLVMATAWCGDFAVSEAWLERQARGEQGEAPQ